MSQLEAEIPSLKSNQNSLSFRFTCALTILLACVWVLCYFCESRLPEIKEQELLSRLESKSVDKIDLYEVLSKVYKTNNQTKSIGTQSNTNIWQRRNIASGSEKEKQDVQFCIVVNHMINNDAWLGPLISILSQSQPSLIFYIQNPHSASQLQTFLSQNPRVSASHALQQLSLPTINYTFIDIVKLASLKCGDKKYIIFTEDSYQFVDHHVVDLFQERMEKIDGVIGYGAGVVVGAKQVRLMQSYSYPKEVLESSSYDRCRFLVSGPIIIRSDLLKKTQMKYVGRQRGLRESLKQLIMMEWLQNSFGRVQYIEMPLVLVDASMQQRVVTSKKIRQELEEIRKQKWRLDKK